jgi:cystathionine beta-lyase
VPDNVYGPTRRFCDESLPALGAKAVYYDPLIGAGIADFLDGASAVLMEAPGSHTFEMPDIPALVAAARAAGVSTMIDNTWATPLIFRPLEHGIDLAVYAGTKYQAAIPTSSSARSPQMHPPGRRSGACTGTSGLRRAPKRSG